jgi:glycosyltransferase involved in cell wall biosynthesis
MIAAGYPFVRVLRQKRQGVVHARDKGFNAAQGDIIGRIDADTIISEDWVATLQRIFKDSAIGAVTGSAQYHDMGWAPLLNKVDLVIRRRLARAMKREVAIQGANMAIRSSVWQDIRRSLCRTGGMHEDFDIAIHATDRGHLVIFDESLVVALGYRQAESSFEDFVAYLMLNPHTYKIHGLKSYRHMYPVIYLAMAFYLLIKILHRGYDSGLQRFSWTKLLLAPAQQRVNPGTFVD